MKALARPRVTLGITPTPLVEARRLRQVAGIEAWVKRDDLIGFAQAGTKTRPLEFLVADALDGAFDCLVGCGGASSNFIAALAAAAAVSGLGCHLVLHGRPVRPAHPNVAAARSWGATVHFTGNANREAVEAAAVERATSLAAGGLRPYVIPRGGATAVGALGCARAVAELDEPRRGQPPARIIVAAGSGTTAAGLVVGVAQLGWPTTVVAAAVSRPVPETRAVIDDLARSCARQLGIPWLDPGSLEVVDAIGPGFGVAGPDAIKAAHLALHTEGIVLDPTYTAKAFAVLVARSRSGEDGNGATVFWHTGGIAGALAALACADPGH
jgi:D-cysteine desulfhydrase